MQNLRDLAKELYDQGLAVIPTNEKKAPIDKSWQTLVGDRRRDPNGEFDGAAGCGVILGQWQGRGFLHALDVDCYNKDVSRLTCEFLAARLGVEFPYRVGEPPKFCVPILLPEPWRKITSDSFGEKSRIEVLGDGQQFVAYGAHPKGKDGRYQWYNGAFDIERVPVLTMDDLWKVLAFFEDQCTMAGMAFAAKGSSARVQGKDDDTDDDLSWAVANAPLGLSRDEIIAALKAYPSQGLDYDSWLKVGAALHHEHAGSDAGYKLWGSWSKQSDKHDAKEMRRKWESFGEQHGKPVTMATVIHLGRRQPLMDPPAARRSFLPQAMASALEIGGHIEWVVEGIIERGTIGQVFAPPGVGKSFFALDMAAHIACGETWNGRRTVKGPVVYLAGEGEAGIHRRRAAIELEYGLSTGDLLVCTMPDFGDARQLKRLSKELSAINPAVIVIDTLARAIVGLNENDSGDMGRIVKAMGILAKIHNCAVMCIHHTAKNNANSARGSGALTGGMDFEIKMERRPGGAVVVSSAKSKDGDGFPDMAFELISVDLPDNFTDNFGNVIRSAVVRWLDIEDVEEAVVRLSPAQALVLAAFQAVWSDVSARQSVPNQILLEHGIDGPAQGLPVERVRDYWRRSQDDLDSAADNAIRMRWKRALDGCVGKGVFRIFDTIMVEM